MAPEVPNSIPFLRFLVFSRSDARAAHAPGQSQSAPNLRSYVYTRGQLRALLKATAQNHNPLRSVDRQTFRTFILVVYATGALVGEVLNLKHADVDLEAGMMTIRSKSFSRSREIPIGADLRDVLRKYLAWRSRKSFKSPHLFVTKDGPSAPQSQGQYEFSENSGNCRRAAGGMTKF